MNKLCAVALFAVMSCSKSSGPGAADPGKETPWAEKSAEQKKHVMKTIVVPRMAKLFAEAPEPEEDVKCSFCHGEAAREGNFEMPSASLPELNPADGFAAHKDDAAMVEFMMKRVVPEMADALGVAPYNPETHEGFGCFNCHKMAQ